MVAEAFPNVWGALRKVVQASKQPVSGARQELFDGRYKHSSADIKSYPTLKLYAKAGETSLIAQFDRLPDSRLSLQGKKETPIDGEFKSTRTKASCVGSTH